MLDPYSASGDFGLSQDELTQFTEETPWIEDEDKRRQAAQEWKLDKLDKESRRKEGNDAVAQAYKTVGNVNQQAQQSNMQYQAQAMKALQLQNSAMSKYTGAGTSNMASTMLASQQPMMMNQMNLRAAQQNMGMAADQLGARNAQRQMQHQVNLDIIKKSYVSQQDAQQAREDAIAQQKMDNAGKGPNKGGHDKTYDIMQDTSMAEEYNRALEDFQNGNISEDEFNEIRWRLKNTEEFKKQEVKHAV